MHRRRAVWMSVLCVACLLAACRPTRDPGSPPPSETPLPTPSSPALQVSAIRPAGARLRVTLPSVKLLERDADTPVQLVLVMADPQGSASYLLYPANRPGDAQDSFDLTGYPLELSLSEDAASAALWVLALHNTRYEAAERFGLDALGSSLAAGFRNWLAEGDPQDDPLAAVVAASEGALYEWFAGVDILGQGLAVFQAGDNWNMGMSSLRSPDGGLSAVYTVQYLSAQDVAQQPTPTPSGETEHPGHQLIVDETFDAGTGQGRWFQGQDSTYVNEIADGAYQIRLTDLQKRSYGLSWGSMDEMRFQDYIIEAEVSLVESGVQDARYGIWFNYQDDYNFIYFGISNRGEYRVAKIQSNSNRREIRNWTAHPAIHPGAATNTLTVEARPNHLFALAINGEPVMTFTDDAFTGGSVAFFCYAQSVPATCRLERLRVWEPLP